MNPSSSGADAYDIFNKIWQDDSYKHDIGRCLREESMIKELCIASRDIFRNEGCLLHLQPPITIAGNFYGHFSKLKSVLEQNGDPPRTNYLFLGNYFDYPSTQSDPFTQKDYDDYPREFIKTILFLLASKIKYPHNVFLLKGDLDHAGIKSEPRSQVDEIVMMERSISSSSINILNDCLKYLPVAALISDKIICTNGGLSPRLRRLDQIKPRSAVLDDLIGKHSGRRGRFPVRKEAEFLEKNGLRLVCCGYNPNASKYEDFAKHRVAFVSSAASGRQKLAIDGVAGDDNTVMRVDASLKCSFHNLRYTKMVWSYQIGMASTAQDACSSGVNPPSGKVGGSKTETNVPSKFQFDTTSHYKRKFSGVKIEMASTAQDVCSVGVNPPSRKVGGSKPEINVPPKSSLIQQTYTGVSPLGSSAFLVLGYDMTINISTYNRTFKERLRTCL